MPPNRSMPSCTVIPVLAYPNVGAASDWLCAAFGFTPRLTIGEHRAQLTAGDGALVITAAPDGAGRQTLDSVMIRVEDVDRHHAQALEAGADILQPPTDQPYGERQYVVRDPAGRTWTFSQTLADVAPSAWGGVLAEDC